MRACKLSKTFCELKQNIWKYLADCRRLSSPVNLAILRSVKRTTFMNKWSETLLPLSAALLLGAILTLAFAPYAIYPLAIFAIAGLFALWLHSSPKQALWRGFLFGLGFFGTGVYWVFISIHEFGDVPSLPAVFITLGLIAALASFPATAGYLINRFFPVPDSTKMVYAMPAIWVFSEWIRSWIFSGFPWLFLGYSQTASPLNGYAPIFSVYGVSLAVAVSSGLLLNSYINYQSKNYPRVYTNILTFIAIWAIGGIIHFIPWTKAYDQPVTLSLIQGNIPQELKWSPEHLQLSFDRYQALTEPLLKKDNIVIWPEVAIPVPLQNTTEFIDMLDAKAQKAGAHIILGIPIQSTDKTGYYNAIVTLGSDRTVYAKRRLVPFGEYIPNNKLLAHLLSVMQIPMAEMVPGNIFQHPLVINNIKILPAICYEIAFPELINTRDSDIGFLLTITNDAWFGESSAQAQHLQMAAMRALELRRPVVFVSNNGITAIIDADGRIKSAAPTHETFVLNGTVQPMQGLTPWMRNGIDPILFILLCMLFAATRTQKKTAKQKNLNHAVYKNA